RDTRELAARMPDEHRRRAYDFVLGGEFVDLARDRLWRRAVRVGLPPAQVEAGDAGRDGRHHLTVQPARVLGLLVVVENLGVLESLVLEGGGDEAEAAAAGLRPDERPRLEL